MVNDILMALKWHMVRMIALIVLMPVVCLGWFAFFLLQTDEILLPLIRVTQLIIIIIIIISYNITTN